MDILSSRKIQIALAGLLASIVLSLFPELEAAGMEQQTIDLFTELIPAVWVAVAGLIGTHALTDNVSIIKDKQVTKPPREVNIGDATH